MKKTKLHAQLNYYVFRARLVFRGRGWGWGWGNVGGVFDFFGIVASIIHNFRKIRGNFPRLIPKMDEIRETIHSMMAYPILVPVNSQLKINTKGKKYSQT